MIQRSPGAFRSTPNGENLGDIALGGFAAKQSGMSAGATLVDQVQLTPKQNQNWALQSVSIEAYLGIGNSVPVFGKLGKVVAAVVTDNSIDATPTQGTGAPWTQKALQLPRDASLLFTLWDPDLNPLPPNVSGEPNPGVAQLLPIPATLQLSLPVALMPGGPIYLGIWAIPALVGSLTAVAVNVALLSVFFASYLLTYDNGL